MKVTAQVIYLSLVLIPATGLPASAQGPAQPGDYRPQRTPWDTPVIEGVWNFSTLTPLERPQEFGDKAVLTPAEARALLAEIRDSARPDEPTGIARLDVEGYNNFWLDPGDSLDRELRTSLIVDPPNGRLPALTPAARQRMLAQNKARRAPVRDILSYSVGPDYLHANPESLGLSERCLVGFNAGPPLVPGPYNNNLRIVQTPQHVMLMTEMVHDVRIIPTDGRPALPRGINQWYGSSVGRWQGDTLIVTTTNFTDKTPVFQLPVDVTRPEVNGVVGSGADMTLVERFTPTGAGQLRYEATVEEPNSFARPFTLRLVMQSTRDRIFEYACHEGNYAMGGILRGARLREREN